MFKKILNWFKPKRMTDIEILIYLKNGLQENNNFLCVLLQDINVKCDFLFSSGLADIWKERGNIISDVWRIKGGYTSNYENKVKLEKKECINILLDKLQNEETHL